MCVRVRVRVRVLVRVYTLAYMRLFLSRLFFASVFTAFEEGPRLFRTAIFKHFRGYFAAIFGGVSAAIFSTL